MVRNIKCVLYNTSQPSRCKCFQFNGATRPSTFLIANRNLRYRDRGYPPRQLALLRLEKRHPVVGAGGAGGWPAEAWCLSLGAAARFDWDNNLKSARRSARPRLWRGRFRVVQTTGGSNRTSGMPVGQRPGPQTPRSPNRCPDIMVASY